MNKKQEAAYKKITDVLEEVNDDRSLSPAHLIEIWEEVDSWLEAGISGLKDDIKREAGST